MTFEDLGRNILADIAGNLGLTYEEMSVDWVASKSFIDPSRADDVTIRTADGWQPLVRKPQEG